MAQVAYWIAHLTSGWPGTPPSGAQVAAGNLQTGSPASYSGSETGFATSGTVTIDEATALSGLSAGTSYTVAWVVYDDVALTYSNVEVGAVQTACTVSLAATGEQGTFAATAQSVSSAAIAATGDAGTFSGTASSPATATLAATGDTGSFAGTASSPAVATLAATGDAGTFAGTAQTNATASLAATGDTGTFAGSASTGASAVVAVTGDSGTFSGTATTPASVALAATGDSGTFAGSAFSSAVASLAVTGDSGTMSALASTVGTADVAVTGDSGGFSGTAFSITTAWLDSLGDSGTFAGSASVASPSTIGRPTSDASNSGWTASTGSDLYAMLDEVVPDAGDYIVATSVGAVCELALNSTVYPNTASQTLKFRASSSTGNSVIVRLKNTGGATVRSVTQALTASDTEYSVTLSAGEIAAITSGALSVQLESA